MRLLLILTVVIAVSALLWGSWQWGRRPFLLTVSLVLAGLITLGVGVWQDSMHDQVRMAPEGIALALTEIRNSESGVRLSGTVRNDGAQDVAALTLQAQALHCSTQSSCAVIYQQPITLQMYLPKGSEYQFAVVSRHPKENTPVDRWQLRVVDKLAYPNP